MVVDTNLRHKWAPFEDFPPHSDHKRTNDRQWSKSFQLLCEFELSHLLASLHRNRTNFIQTPYLIPWITSIESVPNDSVVIISEFLTIQKHDKNRSMNELAIFVLFVWWLNMAVLSTFKTAFIFGHLMWLLLLVLDVKSADGFLLIDLFFVAKYV